MCYASRSHRSPCLVKMKTLAKAAKRSPLPSSLLSRSTWMSLMAPSPRSHRRWSKLSKPSPSLRILPSRLTMRWHDSDSRWPPLTFHQQWMSASVGCEYFNYISHCSLTALVSWQGDTLLFHFSNLHHNVIFLYRNCS